jgi:hypothetical protein
MPSYRMVYGDEEQVVHQTFQDVLVYREDGWTTLFRGKSAILRLRDEHVRCLELVVDAAGDESGTSGDPVMTRGGADG